MGRKISGRLEELEISTIGKWLLEVCAFACACVCGMLCCGITSLRGLLFQTPCVVLVKNVPSTHTAHIHTEHNSGELSLCSIHGPMTFRTVSIAIVSSSSGSNGERFVGCCCVFLRTARAHTALEGNRVLHTFFTTHTYNGEPGGRRGTFVHSALTEREYSCVSLQRTKSAPPIFGIATHTHTRTPDTNRMCKRVCGELARAHTYAHIHTCTETRARSYTHRKQLRSSCSRCTFL